MILKNDRASIRIVKKLEMKRFYFGNFISWKWHKPLFAKPFDIGKRMNPHIVIVGESGGGKSNACRLLIKELCKRNSTIIALDPNSDYLGIADSINAEVYDSAIAGINIFDLDNMSQSEKVSELMGIFRKRLKLGYVQASMLRKCISYAYWIMKMRNKIPTLKDVLYTIKVFERRASPVEMKILATLFERLSLLDSGSFVRKIEIDSIMDRNSIFLLSSLHTDEAQSVYMEGLLRKIYSNMISAKGPRNSVYIIIDEAKKLSESRILGRLVAEGRKYGIGVITVSQRAKEIDRDVLSNSSLFISFYQREPLELNYVANFISGGNELNRFIEVKKAIRSLGIGEAIVLASSKMEPFIVRFELCKSRATSLRYLISSNALHGIRERELLSKAHLLNFTDDELKESIEGLTRSKILYMFEIKYGELGGRWYISNPRNSPEHDLNVNLISRRLSESGIPNEVYNSSYGPDIICYSRGRKIAVEYETGTKTREQLMKMVEFRKKGYEKIIIIVNDANIWKYGVTEEVIMIKATSFFEDDFARLFYP